MSRIPLVTIALFAAFLGLLGALFHSFVFSLSESGSAVAAAKEVPAAATLSPCDRRWNLVYSPNPTSYDVLTSVDAAATNDVWAVGYSNDPHIASLVEHWDGSSWSTVASPALGVLNDVAALSSRDAWVVGSMTDGTSLIEHWDGSIWSVVPSPNVAQAVNTLYSIAAVSSIDIWAVGNAESTAGQQTLTEHWDGNVWTIIPSVNAGTRDNALQGVAAVSGNDVWAVGFTAVSDMSIVQLIEHWNGTEWSMVAGPPGADLRSVEAVSANDVWAVGSFSEQAGEQTLAEHWNGTAWIMVPSPAVGQASIFTSLTVISSNDVWAVGYSTGGTYPDSLAGHWDGNSWSVVSSPSGASLNGVTALSSTELWSVGTGTSNTTLIEHYNATPCINTPTPTILPGCAAGWLVVESADEYEGNTLYGVAAKSANDAWAVGTTGGQTSGGPLPLLEHWDGSTWENVYSGDRGGLYGVASVSSNDVWAVGYFISSSVAKTLIKHWNGEAWSNMPSPNIGAFNNYLYSISVVVSNDIWAVGTYSDGATSQTLIEHWNGNTWSIVPSPNIGTQNNVLKSVAAVSRTDLWAVGNSVSGAAQQTLTEHWDGSTWTIVPSLSIGTSYNILNGVAAISGNDVWAVGTGSEGQLIEHWNGSEWSLGAELPHSDLNSVAAVSSNDIWAVGGYYDGTSDVTLTEHWDGSTWDVAVSENPIGGFRNNLYGVAFVSGTDLWAVGESIARIGSNTLIEHYNGVYCPPTLTPTITPTPEQPRCPGERFTDVCPGDYFYQHVLDLNDLGVVSGYTTAPPCNGAAYVPCYKPENSTTRGQIAKIVSLAAGFSENVSGQTFTDVALDHTFYVYIERMAARGIITGYPCGGPAEPCDTENRPYFRPGNTVSRGQLSKMAAVAFGFDEASGVQKFEDVLPGSTYYDYIWRLSDRTIINGYPCGGQGEPCGAGNLPYFRPANPVTRGQIAKIVNLARLQPSPTPTPTPTITLTPEVTYTPTASDTATVTTTPTSIDTSVPTATISPTTGPTQTDTPTSTP